MRTGSRAAGVALVVAAALALAGCGGASTATPAAPRTQPMSSMNMPGMGLTRSVPVSIDIPSIGARSSLIKLGLNADKSIEVPPVDRPTQAGWYEYGPTPGEIGPAVVLGHIDGDHKEGIFWRLHDVRRGDKVMVSRQDGTTATFAVSKVVDVHKSAFPTSAVYGNTADPQLRLITCGGAFDATTGHYLDNLIVYATLTK